jgi:hypothetical protein
MAKNIIKSVYTVYNINFISDYLNPQNNSGINIWDYPTESWYINFLNKSYLPYYIQEIQKILSGERKENLEMHVDENEDIGDDHILVTKEYVYFQEEYGTWDKGLEPVQGIEIDQLLEFLKIMKKELEIGDEVVIDESDNGYLE